MPSSTKKKTKIAVIGGGLGAMSAAISLAAKGCDVTVFEKGERTGGKMGLRTAGGFRWDTGPSLLTMPHVLRELWRSAGRDLDAAVTLRQLPCTCRYHWADGTTIDEDEAFWNRTDVSRFLEFGGGIYRLSSETFLSESPSRWWRSIRPSFLPNLAHLGKILSRDRLHDVVSRHFSDPRLVQIFDRYATYNGSSPYRTPGTFAVIPYIQATFGGWYVEGGMHRLASGMQALAADLGCEIRTGAEVTGLTLQPTHSGVSVDGDWGRFDGVLCNMDVLSAHQGLLPRETSKRFRDRYLDRYELSSSGFVLLLGVKKKYPQLAHHNVFFSSDYRTEFHEIFRERRPPSEPTIYVCASSRTDPGAAPEGCDNWFVLVNVPATRSSIDWSLIEKEYGDAIIARLESMGFPGLSSQIAVREEITPADFASRLRSYAGSLYGFASHRFVPSFLRPSIDADLPRFCFAGGSTHPGGGVPLVVRSGQIAAATLLRKVARAPKPS